uniref:Uncharacterized protein n=1 Tax=Setaria viridis TaxID=4556 RepID=A0A4U6V2V6_SETVI|nr:hypothetical protein SEVIR_5G407600v2 [Setaria viridis]
MEMRRYRSRCPRARRWSRRPSHVWTAGAAAPLTHRRAGGQSCWDLNRFCSSREAERMPELLLASLGNAISRFGRSCLETRGRMRDPQSRPRAASIGCRCRCMWWPESPRGRCSDAGSWSRHSTCHAATRKLEQHCTSSCWSRARLARASRWLEPCLPRVCVERRGLEMRLARYDSVQMHVTVVVR